MTLRRNVCVRLLLIAVLAVLAGCGFHLRGEANLPFTTLFVSMPEGSPVGEDIKRAVTVGTKTKIVDKAADAEAVLLVLGESREKIILSLSVAGRVNEYLLRYRFSFKVSDGKGHDFLPPNEIILTREQIYNDTQVLAKETEENLLYRDMQRDMVQQLLRRVEAARVPVKDPDAP